MKTQNRLIPLDETVKLIESKRILVIAANEDALRKLPAGNWIGGTIPYFIDIKGGCLNKKDFFITDVTDYIVDFKINQYNENQLEALVKDRYDDGFSYVLIPAFSGIHQKYAVDIYLYPELYNIPTMGWITGIDLAELGKITPKVVNGQTLEISENTAVLLHAKLLDKKYARLEILNLFSQGTGSKITFQKPGFQCTDCLIDGKKDNLAKYITRHNIDTRLPIVADYSGASINVSIQNVDKINNLVSFYAPVNVDVEYRFANNVTDYISEFNKIIPGETSNIIASCNCILNYLYSELEGKQTGSMTGPITFGEIAYVLVNQTLVYLSVEDA
jgi:hypothetical protein